MFDKQELEQLKGVVTEVVDGKLDSLMEHQIMPQFDAMHERFDNVEGRLDRVENRLDRVETKLNDVDVRLEYVEKKIDSQFVSKDYLEDRLVGFRHDHGLNLKPAM